MCSVELALAGIKVAGSVASWQNQRQQAADTAYSNMIKQQNADKSYLENLTRIDADHSRAGQERAAEEFKIRQQRKKEIAKALNAGFGSPLRVMQDMGVAYDQDYADIQFEFTGDMYALANQREDAYTNLQRIYNDIAPVYQPNEMGLLLSATSAGVEGYATGKSLT